MARLEAAEVVCQQYQEDADAGRPNAAAWQQALEEAAGGAPVAPAPGAGATPGAVGQLLIGHRGPDSRREDLPADYRAIMEVVAGGGGPLWAKGVARELELELDLLPTTVEPVRGKLRRLAERGWIPRTPAGRYLPR
ncbi:hypothetical protein P3T30_007126 [Kitasatospora sp. MAP12-9]|uniref:hypothetical protein n=1 Tax=Kitasatospora sp. MAP12-9 TaxID=3035100 RepID=UPI003D1930FF